MQFIKQYEVPDEILDSYFTLVRLIMTGNIVAGENNLAVINMAELPKNRQI